MKDYANPDVPRPIQDDGQHCADQEGIADLQEDGTDSRPQKKKEVEEEEEHAIRAKTTAWTITAHKTGFSPFSASK